MSQDFKAVYRPGREENQLLKKNLDIAYDSDGDIEVVENEALLSQAAAKNLMTKIGEDGAYPLHGSYITRVIGLRNTVGVNKTLLSRYVADCLVRLQDTQMLQLGYQDLNSAEVLKRIEDLQIESTDDESYVIKVRLRTPTGSTVLTSAIIGG